MANISSPGIGSGLDVNAIVSQMMKIEQQPLQLLQTKASGIQTRISSYGQIKSAMAALYDAAKGLGDVGTWQAKQFTSGDESILKGSASSTAQAAQFSVKVNALAQSQSVSTQAFATGATMGASGTLTLQTGRWSADQSSFTGNGPSIGIQIDASDTLASVADKINQQNAGVSAVVVKSADGDRLLVRGSQTGEDSGFSLSVSDPGLDALAHDPASVAGGSGATRTQAAQDASISVDGIDVRSASNTVKDVVAGVTLNLVKVSSQAVDISVGSDAKAVKDKVQAFADAYNKLNTLIADQTRYDPTTKKSQPLQGDGTILAVQGGLRGLIGTPNANGKYLSSFGLELQRDGSLSINATKLDAAMQDMPALQQALTGETTGLITRVRDFAFRANGVDGNITSRANALQNALKSNQSDQDRMSMLLDQRQKSMLRQYQALDANMASMSALNSFISSQVSQWNKS